MVANWLQSKWLGAVLCGLLGYAIEFVRQEPSFGVGLTLWVLPALFAATFFGFLPAAAAGVISTALLALTTNHFFDLSEGITSLAMVIFVAFYLRISRSLRVVDGVCLYWLVGTPLFIFYHRDLWALDFNGGLLLLAKEVVSHLLPALFVQWLTLAPSFYKRWLPVSDYRPHIQTHFTLMALARIVLLPATFLPAMLAVQVFSTESIFVRQQNFQSQVEQLSIAHARRAELMLSKATVRALSVPIDNPAQYDALTASLLEDMPWVCALARRSLVSDVVQQPAATGHCPQALEPQALDMQASGRPADAQVLSMVAGDLLLWIDLARLNQAIAAVEHVVPFTHTTKLVPRAVEPSAVGAMRITPLPYRGKSQVEALFRSAFTRTDIVAAASLSAPLAIQVEAVITQPIDAGLAVSIWSLLTTLVFILALFALYRRWLGLIAEGVTLFVARISRWRVGDSADDIAVVPVGGLLQELSVVSSAFQRLIDQVNSTYQAVNELSAERSKILGQMSAVYRSIHAPIFVLDDKINPLVDQSNAAAASLMMSLGPVFEEARRALADVGNDEQCTPDKAPMRQPTLAQALCQAAACGKHAADIEFDLSAMGASENGLYLCAIDVISGAQQSDQSAQGLVLVMMDISELAQTRRQLMHSAKMVSIGEVASGAAHELNQPLNVIRMATHNLLRGIDKGNLPPEQVHLKLERINQQVDRAARLIAGMKAFARTSHETVSLINPSEAISVALELLAKRIHAANVQLVHQSLEGSCVIESDTSALQQMIIVLVDNALDAFEARGTKEPHLRVSEVLDDGNLVLTVADNGGGIAPEIIDRIFEPFFTTREHVGNSGLGLSTLFGIVSELKGQISAANDEHGAVFTVVLPLPQQHT